MAVAPLSLALTIDCPDQTSAYKMGVRILEEIQKQLSGPRTGRWYPSPSNKWYDKNTPKEVRAKNYYIKYTGTTNRSEIVGSAYRASAPGESPAVRTGRLRQSFVMVVAPSMNNLFSVTVRTNVTYADDLEFGTDKIDPRPFMSKVMKKVTPDILRMRVRGMLRLLK